ncbi:MAG: hypothetical protein AAGB48_06570 [Planctomycetota bacterium]
MGTPADSKTRILKFGSSVLRMESDLPDVAAEVYRHFRSGTRLVVVVSAFRGRTDHLCRLAAGLDDRSPARAALLGSGELEAAAAVAVALERCGLPARYIEPGSIGITAEGDRAEAWPTKVEPRAIAGALASHEIPVVPGYVARDEAGEPSLLGRGGSDLTAIALGAALNAETVLIKGAGAVFEWDPEEAGPPPGRFLKLGFDEALALGDRVIQPRAIRYARENGIPFRCTGLRSLETTHIVTGAGRAELTHEPIRKRSQPARIALLGLGTVGGGVASLLARDPDRYELVGALVRNSHKRRDFAPRDLPITTDVDRLLDSNPDIVVEMLGGVDRPLDLAQRSIRSGADCITANKALLAHHGLELERLASTHGRRILGSACVGGALPALELVAHASSIGRVVRIRGVLNGTTNYVLEQCAAGATLDEASDQARALGYAEADLSGDLGGEDAGYKIMLLARALGHAIDGLHDVQREALTDAACAAPSGKVRRQVAECDLTSDQPSASVRLVDLDPADPLVVAGAGNTIAVTLDTGAVIRVKAQGAGRWPTAQSVVSDIDDLIDGTIARSDLRVQTSSAISKGTEP